MKFELVLKLYRDGHIARGNVLGDLPQISRENIDSILGACPPEVLDLLAKWLRDRDPNAEQIELPPQHRGNSHSEEEDALMVKWLTIHSYYPPPD